MFFLQAHILFSFAFLLLFLPQYSFTDMLHFCEITTADMMTVQEMIVSQSQTVGNSAVLK
jgi:type II restriction/modification system DNA methylase subunit YeeA